MKRFKSNKMLRTNQLISSSIELLRKVKDEGDVSRERVEEALFNLNEWMGRQKISDCRRNPKCTCY